MEERYQQIRNRLSEIETKRSSSETGRDVSDEDFEWMTDTLDPIYCSECGACGHDGCCSVHKCLYVKGYQGDYDNLVHELQQWKDLAGHLLLRGADKALEIYDEDRKVKLLMVSGREGADKYIRQEFGEFTTEEFEYGSSGFGNKGVNYYNSERRYVACLIES